MTCTKWTRGGYTQSHGGVYDTLCTSKGDFIKTREGVPFEIKRRGFVDGTVDFQAQKIDHINKRFGTGNYNIKRDGFDQPPPTPRTIIDFDKLQAMDLDSAGQRVQLSEKSLSALFDIAVPDDQDTKWLAEKNRLTLMYRRQGMTGKQITAKTLWQRQAVGLPVWGSHASLPVGWRHRQAFHYT